MSNSSRPPISLKLNAGVIKKDQTARAKFVDVGVSLLQRMDSISAFNSALCGRLELAVALSELPEELAARALVSMCIHDAPAVWN